MTSTPQDRKPIPAPGGLSHAEATARQAARQDVPAGCLPVHRWYLRRPPGPLPTAEALPSDVSLVSAQSPPAAYYRFLYGAVGRDWLWWERLKLNDAALQALIGPSTVEITVMFRNGVPQGYFELNRAPEDPENRTVDLAYFGLMPWAVGEGLGPRFLRAALLQAGAETRPMTVNTCTLDHPRALGLYQRAGFVEERAVQFDDRDPRLDGALPRDAAPQFPLASQSPA